jgi:hypothetical protein
MSPCFPRSLGPTPSLPSGATTTSWRIDYVFFSRAFDGFFYSYGFRSTLIRRGRLSRLGWRLPLQLGTRRRTRAGNDRAGMKTTWRGGPRGNRRKRMTRRKMRRKRRREILKRNRRRMTGVKPLPRIPTRALRKTSVSLSISVQEVPPPQRLLSSLLLLLKAALLL